MSTTIKKHGKFKKKLLQLIAAAIAVMLATGVIVYSEYTKSNRAKRVIATVGEGGMLFSSNYLKTDTAENNSYAVRNLTSVFTGNPSIEASADITICNYAQGNPGKVNTNDITYTLSAKLVKRTGSSDTFTDATAGDVGTKYVRISYKGTIVTLNNSKLSISGFSPATLAGMNISTDICNVTFSGGFHNEEDTDNLYLFIKAVPSESSGLPTLDAMLSTAKAEGKIVYSWNGAFTQRAVSPKDQDGFEYVISGTGAGIIKLRWQNQLLTPNQRFLTQLGVTAASETDNGVTWSYITFGVDSSVINRYDTQFYYLQPNETGPFETWKDTNFPNWDTVNNYIEVIFTPSGT